MDKQNVRISVNEGAEFFAHETAVNFNPLQFIFDFKSVTPRVDLRSKEQPTIVIRHNVIMVDPYHAKQIMNLLNDSISKYEKEFGEIKKPKSIEKAEKRNKTKMADASKESKNKSSQNYFG